MKKLFIFFTLVQGLFCVASGQQKQIDSLRLLIVKTHPDTNRIKILLELGNLYKDFKPDTAVKLADSAYRLALLNKSEKYQSKTLNLLGNIYVDLGDYAKGIHFFINAKDFYERIHDEYDIIIISNNIGSAYHYKKEYKKALSYLYVAKNEFNHYNVTNKQTTARHKTIYAFILENIGECYLYTHQTDSAAFYFNEGSKYTREIGFKDLDGLFANDLGQVEELIGNRDAALKQFRRAAAIDADDSDIGNSDLNYLSISNLFDHLKQPDSAVYYARLALYSARNGKFQPDVLDASTQLYKLFDEQHNVPEAYKYFKIATRVKDSIFSQEKIRELVAIDFEAKQHQQEILAARIAYTNKVRIYLFIAGFAILLLLAFLFWRNGRQRKQANAILKSQKDEIELTLLKLKTTQTQLIQSEKMASLGELTAGIAHEIQNPLNFVNNFSEVNREMIVELRDELDKGDVEEAKAIAADIEQNEVKINHHGKRADAIVKGMLEHSRSSTGQKEPTDINKLADEYMRLAYHGFRAKVKSFNAEMVTHFDEKLPLVNVITQDMGRVMLNLFNNAFYAVNQKQQTAGKDYKPEVSVTTTTENGQVVIKVKDNGNGIPESIKDKIMQPFFTTKPTGEGTGLGLSLSYDIVVKGHGGSMNIENAPGEGAKFIITIPNE